MKPLLRTTYVIMLLLFVSSCKDKKKEEAETKAAVIKIEAVEQEVNSISEELDQQTTELEDALKVLDSI